MPMTKFLFPTKKTNDNIFKKSMENQLAEVIREKKRKILGIQKL